jgi:hypothetical protein
MKQVFFAVLLVTASLFTKADGNAQDVAKGFITSQQNQHKVDTTYYVSDDLFLVRKITETTTSLIGDSISHKTVTETSRSYGKIPATFGHLSSAQVQSLIKGDTIEYSIRTASVAERADFHPHFWWSVFTQYMKPLSIEQTIIQLVYSHGEVVVANKTISYISAPWYVFWLTQMLFVLGSVVLLSLSNYKIGPSLLFGVFVLIVLSVLFLFNEPFTETFVGFLPIITVYLPVIYGLRQLTLYATKKMQQKS